MLRPLALRLLIVCCAFAAAFTVSGSAAVSSPPKQYIVDTTADDPTASISGCDFPNSVVDCSLAGAIKDANTHLTGLLGPDSITFSIGTGVKTITLSASTADITDGVSINATTQTADANCGNGVPCIRINASAAFLNAFTIKASNVTIRDLSIYGFHDGDGIKIASGANAKIAGNFIGSADGQNQPPIHGQSGVEITGGTAPIVIGGTAPLDRNIISGNDEGVIVAGGPATIQGNYIGLARDGNTSLANRQFGVLVKGGTAATIGGTGAGAGNVISGNAYSGISGGILLEAQADVQGNLIGTNAVGTMAVPNDVGISTFQASGTIGGTSAAARNVISGNTGNGIEIVEVSSMAVQGNYIGLTADGTAKLGNASGIVVGDAGGTSVGGTEPGAGNVISGNSGPGIWLLGPGGSNAPGVPVEGNYIGTDAAGTAAVGNASDGVLLDPGTGGGYPDNNNISENLIAGNGEDGIRLKAPASGNSITGNYIGTNASLGAGLGNAINGISVLNALGNQVGGAGLGNTIMYNGSRGVQIDGAGGIDNRISQNSIDLNGGLGIDNTDGGNIGQPPVLASATAGSTHITGMLQSTPTTQFTIEFFRSPSCDTSGFGEGRTFLGATTVSTIGDGSAVIDADLPANTPGGEAVTATATDPGNNTSNFSNCVTMVGPTSTPTLSPSASPTPTMTPTPTATPTPTGTPTHTPIATPTHSPRPTPGENALNGDANCDGHVDLDDMVAVLSELGGVAPGAPCAERADTNCNGSLDADDALRIVAHVAGTPLPQPTGCRAVGA